MILQTFLTAFQKLFSLPKKGFSQFDFQFISRVIFGISFLGIIAVLLDFGYQQSVTAMTALHWFYFIILSLGLFNTLRRYIVQNFDKRKRVLSYDSIYFLVVLIGIIAFLSGYSYRWEKENTIIPILVRVGIALTFLREYADLKINYKRTLLNPAQLFIVSFLVIILLGAYLLSLPNATYNGISFIDALFTATSAVCVTGLIVVDTATVFTTMGHVIILILIQIGGLGILTFASYFSYFFSGHTSYENQLTLSDITYTKKLNDVFSSVRYIILITLCIEIFSAIGIFFQLDSAHFQSLGDRLFFSLFHAVSAFCNAGFSTLSAGLYDVNFRFNYGFQLFLALTIILGGLGFPIVVNILDYLKYKALHFTNSANRSRVFKPWVVNLNSRLALMTTVFLTVTGTLLFYILEYHNVLGEHHGIGKIIAAFFGAVTPRTAGFNHIDFAELSMPTMMLVFLLMWIGASPQSTGGGVKTTTFAIAMLNILALAKGKDRLEIYRREIADNSVRRAFAIISLSLLIIGLAVMMISVFDPHISLLDSAFECFSAYSTVGLSLGITGKLSLGSKMVLITVMFIGRITMLTILIALFKKDKFKNYRYPSEDITIN